MHLHFLVLVFLFWHQELQHLLPDERVHSEVQVALRSDFYLRATEVSLQFVSLLETKFHFTKSLRKSPSGKIVLFVNFPVKMPILMNARITAPKFFSCKMVIYLFWFSI